MDAWWTRTCSQTARCGLVTEQGFAGSAFMAIGLCAAASGRFATAGE